jgi:hypothetical protein
MQNQSNDLMCPYCLHPLVYYYIVLLYNQHNKFVINQYYFTNIYYALCYMFRSSWIIIRKIFMKCTFVLNCITNVNKY